MERMNDCKNIHEECWQAIRVKHMLERSRLWQITKGHVVQPVAEDINIDIEMPEPKHEHKDNRGPKFPSINNVDQEMLAARKNKQVLEVPHIYFVLGDCQTWRLQFDGANFTHDVSNSEIVHPHKIRPLKAILHEALHKS